MNASHSLHYKITSCLERFQKAPVDPRLSPRVQSQCTQQNDGWRELQVSFSHKFSLIGGGCRQKSGDGIGVTKSNP